MGTDNSFFDDLARMAGGAASLMSTVRRQVQSDIKDRTQSYTNRMDLAARDEVERLQASVNKYRTEQEQMKKRIADLEAMMGGKASSAPVQKSPAKKKPSAKKPVRK